MSRLILVDGDLSLRPLAYRDGRAWTETRLRNAGWLKSWEATSPPESMELLPSFRQMVRRYRAEARAGRALSLALLVDGTFCGQVTLGGITWGSLRSGYVGYWIDEAAAGQGYMPRAVALVIDHAIFGMGLHRVEINIRPENVASLRVAEKLRLRNEGIRERYLHIDGQWRDHITFAVTSEEVGPGLITRVKKQSVFEGEKR